jgi:predicted SAM-dependent methyltransferase
MNRGDVRKLTYADNSVDAVAAIHIIEHFYLWEVTDILQEWKRVLKPGGKLILELPCMDKVFWYIAKCIEQNVPMKERFSAWALWGDPYTMDEGMMHRWGYFIRDMSKLLTSAGFKHVTHMEPRYHQPLRDMRFEATK